ncbi:MAG: DUF2480 family protein [Chitinophagales bacterium]|nr:DUF2480 family protein [Chitinophagales bacterium]MDW8417836.1 DUF2480 family protein [Chitinophagales bacterium]
MEPTPIINKVAQKSIITLDLEELIPLPDEVAHIDLKQFLYMELILREAEFRHAVKQTDWKQYEHKYVNIYCSASAVVPMWAYMVISAEVSQFAKDVVCTPPEHAAEVIMYRNIARLDVERFRNQRVVVKGCGERQISEAAYVYIAHLLAPVVRALSFGEPCSMVPVYKK